MADRGGIVDGALLILLAVLAALAALAYAQGGGELLRKGFAGGGRLLTRYALVLVVSFLAAGLAEVLVPHAWVRDTLGGDSGLRGILIGAAAGVVTPSGPFVAMPIAAVMVRSGAAPGPVVAFLTGWALLALHRLVAWEIPMLGWQLAALRYGVSLVLPVVAGLLARAVARG